jgi:hypothetical protein
MTIAKISMLRKENATTHWQIEQIAVTIADVKVR